MNVPKLLLIATMSTGVSAYAADEAFVQKAAMGGLAEVAAGSLAEQKGSSDAVKKFGAQLVADHTKTNEELKQIAATKNVAVPTEPDPAHKAPVAKLRTKSSASFDQGFKAQMVADHKATIALFQKESKNGSDPDLKAFAAKALPALEEHLKMAQALK